MGAPSRPLNVGLVIDGTDQFIQPVEAELGRFHPVERFTPRFLRLPVIGLRVNEHLLNIQLMRFLERQDVVFFEWAASLLVRVSHLPKRGRVVARLHSFELAMQAEQINWRQVDQLIILNETVHNRLCILVHDSLPPVAIVNNGVDLDRYLPGRREFNYRLGMVCNLLPIKRVYEVILSLYQLRQRNFPFTLHIAGNPVDEERRYAWALESLVRKLGLADQVIFYGFVKNVANWLRDIDILVSNSYWEGQQVALMEAMASGCYCLSHCWDGVEKMLPPEYIYTTEAQLQEKLLNYAALPEDAKHQAQAQMRAIAEAKFDERRMVREIVQIIETVGTT